MDFIYRLPLIQFDVHDPAAIQKNYPQILEAVRLSSPSLYDAIHQKPYGSLTENQKLKLHKYLLRGKYRAVPFGMWSGVGIGKAGHENHVYQVEAKALSDCSRTFKTFADKTSDPQYLLKGAFRLTRWIYQLTEEYFYWKFNMKEQLWEPAQVKRNKVLDTVFSHRKSQPEITFTLFSSWFDVRGERDLILEAWKSLIYAGFLISSDFPDMNRFATSQYEQCTVADSRVTAPVQLSPTSLQQLEIIIKEMGELVKIPLTAPIHGLLYIRHNKQY